ncbi:MAG TPA: hypothetical protein VFT70_04585 [Nocardioides sp.]|nr:hypothetical protein [Nocardioides sp.]
MTIYTTTQNPVRSDVTPVPTTRASRRWAYAGLGAGLAGVGTIMTSGMVNAVYDKDLVGNTPAIADKLADQTGPMFVFHSVTVVGAVLIVVFAAGLFQRLRRTTGPDALAPLVAFAGLVGTAVVSVIGSGLDTEFMMGLGEDEAVIDPTNAVMYNHWIGTVPWCWVLAGLAGLALFAASRAGAVPRWIGVVGLVLGGLTLIAGISPLQYIAGMFGPLWLIVTAAGFCFGDRAQQ